MDEFKNAGTSRRKIQSRWLVDEVETNSESDTRDCSNSANVEMTRSDGSCGAENQIDMDKYLYKQPHLLLQMHRDTMV